MARNQNKKAKIEFQPTEMDCQAKTGYSQIEFCIGIIHTHIHIQQEK